MLLLCYGSDDFAIEQALLERRARLGDPQWASLNLATLDGARLTVDELRGAAGAMPFLAERRLVIVHGLLARFESKRDGGKTKARGSGPADELERFAQVLTTDAGGQLPPTTDVILVEGPVDLKRNPLWKLLDGPGAEQQQFSLPKESDLPAWVLARARARGGAFQPAAAALLVRAIGQNTRLLAGEVEKLLTYAVGRSVVEEDVRQLVVDLRSATVFQLVDAVLQRRTDAALRALHRLLVDGAVPQQLFVMIARQFRLARQARDLLARQAAPEEVRRTLGLQNDWVLRELTRQAQAYTVAELDRALERLVDIDRQVKTGRLDAEVGLELLATGDGR